MKKVFTDWKFWTIAVIVLSIIGAYDIHLWEQCHHIGVNTLFCKMLLI